MTSNEAGPSLHPGSPSDVGKPSVTRPAPQKPLPYAQHHGHLQSLVRDAAASSPTLPFQESTSPPARQVQAGCGGAPFVYLLTWLLLYGKTTLPPFFLLLPKKLLPEFAKEAGRLLWLQESPKHNLKTKAKTQCGNNIEEHHVKELPVKQLLCLPIPFQGRETIK